MTGALFWRWNCFLIHHSLPPRFQLYFPPLSLHRGFQNTMCWCPPHCRAPATSTTSPSTSTPGHEISLTRTGCGFRAETSSSPFCLPSALATALGYVVVMNGYHFHCPPGHAPGHWGGRGIHPPQEAIANSYQTLLVRG